MQKSKVGMFIKVIAQNPAKTERKCEKSADTKACLNLLEFMWYS